MSVYLVLLVLALGLAADAFAVALAQGAAGKASARGALVIGASFGLAQALMPLLGWAAGVTFVSLIRDYDHWIAFALLSVLGLKTIKEGMTREEWDAGSPRQSSGWALAGAAVATSVDAAAAGVTLPSIGAPILLACAVIGAVTFLVCTAGFLLGSLGGTKLGRPAEVIGGVALLAIGIKIVADHTGVAG